MRGFSLIELIVVIVVLGVLCLGFANFFSQNAAQYLEANARTQLSTAMRSALERMARELRDALPNSIRIDSAGNCIEFMPIVQGGSYLDAPTSSPATQFEAVDSALAVSADYVSIMPLQSDEVYGVSGSSYPPSLIGFAGTASANTNTIYILLSGAKRFAHDSAAHRFFLTQTPVSFCIDSNGKLWRFHDYGNLAAQSSTLTGGDLLAQDLVQGDATEPVFRYSPGNLTRNALVDIRLILRTQNEQLRSQHEVMLRNVP